MLIRLLGPTTIDGTVVPGARLATLAETLVLAGGRAVPVGDLVDAVWDGDAPADAAGALQALVSRLRRTGLVITSGPGGYRVDLTGVDVDVLEARRLLTAARVCLGDGAEKAADLAAQALALWDDADAPTGSAGPAGAASLHTDLLSLLVEAELRAGRTVTRLADLRAAVDANPTDEPLTALLLRALASDGREAEAVERYEALRARLGEQYGTDPSPVVADVHLALLRGELSAAPARVVRDGALAAPSRAHRPAAPALGWRRAATPLVGREEDIDAVLAELTSGPLVTLVAVGGAGKTRLAVEVAQRAAEAGRAVRAVELAGLREADEVLPTLLAALGASETTTDVEEARSRRVLPVHERLVRALAEVDGLLVLDNCEHLLGAVADVTAQVLEVARPTLRILATSRAPLGVLGETVHPVGMLPDDDALRLLESRARAGRPDLVWDPEPALELCHRLDNLPLALELAAARLRSMPLAAVLAGVDKRFGLLDNALRGLPDRHQGLWSMVDWSWDLLDPAAQTLLTDLAVVPGPFTAELAVAIAEPADTERHLATLVDQSLLALEDRPPGRPARYRMLETVREYGEARLALRAGREPVMARLAHWSAVEARRLREAFIGHDQLVALQDAAVEHETFTAALRWAIDGGREREAYAIAATLLVEWTLVGMHVEGVTWCRALLHADSPEPRAHSFARVAVPDLAAPDADDVHTVAAVALLTAGIVSDLRVAALGRRVGLSVPPSTSGRGHALFRLATQIASLDTETHLVAAAELGASDDPYLQALGLFLHGAVQENQGDIDEASQRARRAYLMFESFGDHWGMGMAAMGIGQWESGRGGEADIWLTRAMEHLGLIGAAQDVRSVLVVREMRRALLGSAEAVAVLDEIAQSPWSSADDRARASLGLGVVAAQNGDWAETLRRADDGLAITYANPAPSPQSRIMSEVTAAVLRIRAGADGEPLLGLAAAAALRTPDVPVLGSVALGYAELAVSRGDLEHARVLWALGTRLGANLARAFGTAVADQFNRAIGSPEEREALLADAFAMSMTEAKNRVAALLSP
ncbi:MAG TPA: BTAD domain-containing putative transcriptional regulator [Actinotalea sp.]